MGFLKIEKINNPDTKEDLEYINRGNSVSCLVMMDKFHGLFVRQFRAGAKKHIIECPAGMIEPGETPEEAIIRELREELGLDRKFIKRLTSIGSVYGNAGYSNEIGYTFIATLTDNFNIEDLFEQQLDDNESLDFQVSHIDDILTQSPMPIRTSYLILNYKQMLLRDVFSII
jgi:ADP-ribose pyrophosphatase